jgi:hypothetical protein
VVVGVVPPGALVQIVIIRRRKDILTLVYESYGQRIIKIRRGQGVIGRLRESIQQMGVVIAKGVDRPVRGSVEDHRGQIGRRCDG